MTLSHYELIGPSKEPNDLQVGGDEKIGFRFSHCIAGGASEGVKILRLDCGSNSIEIVPTRGMGISKAFSQGTEFGWNSPVQGPVHPMWVQISEPSGLGWLDGFDEMMVRCGISSNGAPEFDSTGKLLWPLHGRIANLPASSLSVEIDEEQGSVVARGAVLETRFHFYRWQLETEMRLSLDSNEIQIVDRITNLSDRECSFQMLYHNNFGTPVLEAGARLHAPAIRVAPRNAHTAKNIENWNQFSGPDPSFAEQVYFLDLKSDSNNESTVVLANSSESVAASVRFDTKTLPCFSLWKNTVGINDGYVCGLEPATNFPNPRSFEEKHDRVVACPPGESVEMKFSIGMSVGKTAVEDAVKKVDSIFDGDPELLSSPMPDWSAPE